MPASGSVTPPPPRGKRKGGLLSSIYVQVLAAILIGGLLGHFFPEFGTSLQPLGAGFIKLVKMAIAPIIFVTVATGIAAMRDLRGLGRVVGKAFTYFISVSTLALVIGMVVANVVRPGEGMNIDPSSLSAEPLQGFVKTAEQQSIVGFLLHVIPDSLVGAFTGGDLLQVLFVAVLFGLALAICGDAAQPVVTVLNAAGKALFQVVHLIMRAAPIGALGAFAFTIGNYGIESIASLAKLVATVYATSAGFVVIVLGAIAALSGFSLFRLIVYLREEILLVLGTSSSESALPNLIEKLERAGCAKSIVGIVVPTGYSFNLDGTNIYLTLAAIFVAQATNTPLPLSDQVLLLVVAVLSSKGAAGVTGAGFVTLAATLSVVPAIPLAGLTLILGVDRFMSECRSVTNFIGNAVATIVVAKWEGRLDAGQLAQALAARPPLGPTPPPEPGLALASEQKP